MAWSRKPRLHVFLFATLLPHAGLAQVQSGSGPGGHLALLRHQAQDPANLAVHIPPDGRVQGVSGAATHRAGAGLAAGVVVHPTPPYNPGRHEWPQAHLGTATPFYEGKQDGAWRGATSSRVGTAAAAGSVAPDARMEAMPSMAHHGFVSNGEVGMHRGISPSSRYADLASLHAGNGIQADSKVAMAAAFQEGRSVMEEYLQSAKGWTCDKNKEKHCKCLFNCKVFGGKDEGKCDSEGFEKEEVLKELMSRYKNASCDATKCLMYCAEANDCLTDEGRDKCLQISNASHRIELAGLGSVYECDVDCNYASLSCMSCLALFVAFASVIFR